MKKLYDYILVFFVGSCIGYLYEEIFYLLSEHVLVNRGFLYGPYLPVYGWGSVGILFFTKKYKDKPILTFLLIMLVAGILEYFTGYAMMQIWHKRWWDYTGLLLSIDGYVCLRSILSFGVGGMILIYYIDPLLMKISKKLKINQLKLICYMLCLIYVIDNIFSFIIRN